MKHYAEDVFMKRCIKRTSSIFLLIAAFSSIGQDIPLGTWRNHFSFRNARLLASGEERVFCAVQNGLFFIDLSDNSINKLSKLDGLSDVGATSLAYDEPSKTLIVGYASGLIDLVSNQGVKTIRDINKTNLPGVKTIRDIALHQGKAYLATSFGVVVVSLENKEITETFRSIGFNGQDVTVLELEIVDDQIFAIMDNGIQSGFLNTNLLDFNNWKRYDETFAGQYNGIAALNGKVYTIEGNNDIAVLEGSTWFGLGLNFQEGLVDVLNHQDVLYVLSESAIYTLESSTLKVFRNPELLENANSFTYNNGFWVADAENGLLGPNNNPIVPNGPISDEIKNLSFTNQNLFALYGPTEVFFDDHIDSLGYSYFDNQKWHNETIDGFYNITDVEFFNDRLYFSSAGFGLYNQSTGEVLDHTNSQLVNGWSKLGPVITEMEQNGNLHLLATDSVNSLYMMDETEDFTPYSAGYVGTEIPISIDISENGVLWVGRRDSEGGGIIVLDPDDDNHRVITTNHDLPSSVINGIVIDRNDEAWIATASGPAFYPDASFPFDGANAIQPIFENRLLFENENISSITVDGGNRIWLSTGTGVYVFNNNITELISRFTIENSPLPSNRVRQFAYNNTNGEMYMLTDKGVVSFRTSSSSGQEVHKQVNIFPNPVRPGYSGLVGIDGLVTDASVKITDVNGKLIRHLDASGGTAAWDLMDYNMNRVNTGIYIIFSSSADGEETYIGKIAVVN